MKFKEIKNRKRWRSLSLNGMCITKIGVSPYLSTIQQKACTQGKMLSGKRARMRHENWYRY
ncbi:hypothetical protein DD571_30535 [Klebsiella pneumoniae]|nr:hypothetical protein DD571_30535 [Klebsiella pneumoniae]